MEKIEKELTEKQEKFCRFYCDIDSETFGQKGKSAERAGYAPKSCWVEAWRLLRKDYIIAKIEELRQGQVNRSGLSKSKILCDLESNRQRSMDKDTDGGRTNARECSKLQAQITGLLKAESYIDASDEQRTLTEREKAECKRLASLSLLSDIQSSDVESEVAETVG